LVTFLTPPADAAPCAASTGGRQARLEEGRRRCPDVGPRDSLSLAVLGWVLGCTFVYAALFGAGNLLYGEGRRPVCHRRSGGLRGRLDRGAEDLGRVRRGGEARTPASH
jgi:hypothetical protein